MNLKSGSIVSSPSELAAQQPASITIRTCSMRVWTVSPKELKHVRAIAVCAVYLGGRRAKLELKSGQFLVGVIVSTNFGTELPDEQTELCGQATLSAVRMFGEFHILPDVGRLTVLQATEIEAIEPFDHSRAGALSPRSTRT
jgi:hypothetical protein